MRTASRSPLSAATPRHRAFTLVELLVVIAVIGVLISLLLPAVQSAREAARATHCKNNLRQVALATQLHHGNLGYFPPARFIPRPNDPVSAQCGQAAPTWIAHVLPYMDEASLMDHWTLGAAWYMHNEDARKTVIHTLLCPSRRSGGDSMGMARLSVTKTQVVPAVIVLPCGCMYNGYEEEEFDTYREVEGALSDYAGNHGDLSPGANGEPTDYYYGGNGTGVIIGVRPICENGLVARPRDRVRIASVSDGTTNTFLFGEKFIPGDQVTKYPYDSPAFDGGFLPASSRLAGPGLRLASGPSDVVATEFSFGSWHPGGVHFAMVDGGVRTVTTDTDTEVLGSLANRLDANVVELAN